MVSAPVQHLQRYQLSACSVVVAKEFCLVFCSLDPWCRGLSGSGSKTATEHGESDAGESDAGTWPRTATSGGAGRAPGYRRLSCDMTFIKKAKGAV